MGIMKCALHLSPSLGVMQPIACAYLAAPATLHLLRYGIACLQLLRGHKLHFVSSALICLQEVACYLGLELGEIKIKRFADGEIYVQVGESIRGCDVFLIQPTSPPVNDNMME